MAENYIDHGNMTRDTRDEWSKDEPIGSFDITWDHGVGGYPEANGHILFVCPNNKRCAVLLGHSCVDNSNNDRCSIWQFNGNLDKPTLTPSINCIAEKDGKPTGGCGWHGFITDGVIK